MTWEGSPIQGAAAIVEKITVRCKLLCLSRIFMLLLQVPSLHEGAA